MKRNLLIVVSLLGMVAVEAQDIKPMKITELERMIAESKTPLVINFWATYCVPCVEEIPYFQSEVKKYEKQGMKLLLVSLDMKSYYPQKVQNFVKQKKFTAPVIWLNETDADYFCPRVDVKWSGSLPATLFINNRKGYRKFYEEQMSEAQLKKELQNIL